MEQKNEEFLVVFAKMTDTTVSVRAGSADEAITRAIDSGEADSRLCGQCESERNDGEWEPLRVYDSSGEEVRDLAKDDRAAALMKHYAETITQGEGNAVLIDCACGAEIFGVMSDSVASTVGAIQLVMAPHLAEKLP